MSSKAPWIRWFTSDWVAATSYLGPLEEGVYSKLIHHYYLTRKPLPTDLDRLCMIARATEPASRRAVEYVASEFFHRSADPEFGECLRHPRADEEIAYSDSKHLEALSKGLKTAWLRHGSEDARAQLESLGLDVPPRKFSSTSSSTSSSTCSSTTSTTTQQLPKNQNQIQNQEPPLAPPRGGTRAHAKTFTPPTVTDVRRYANEKGLRVDPEHFVDHYTSNGWKVGGKAPMKCWKSAVRNWARTGSISLRPRHHSKAESVQSANDQLRAKYAGDVIEGECHAVK